MTRFDLIGERLGSISFATQFFTSELMQKFHVAALVIGLQGFSSIDYADDRQRRRSLG
jgi:hypothetical protein